MQARCEMVQLAGSTHDVRFHAAVVEVAYPARHSNASGAVLSEPAETDTLHSAGNQQAACRNLFFHLMRATGGTARAGPFSECAPT